MAPVLVLAPDHLMHWTCSERHLEGRRIALKGAFYEGKLSTGAYLLKKDFLVNISRTVHFTSIKGLPLSC